MIQIAICDDNAQDIMRLKLVLQDIMSKYFLDYNIQEFGSGEKLMEIPLTAHLIFLDIVMKNGKDGIEVGRQIYRKNRTVKIIFQTNYSQYCKEALNKSHAFAYLEKPLMAPKVEEQIKEFLENGKWAKEIRIEFRNVKCKSETKEGIKAVINLPVRQIIYFEHLKLKKEIRIVTDQGIYTYIEALNKLESRMRPFGFETSCRGILVNLERVKKIKGYKVILDNDSQLPLSQRRVAEFKERLNEFIHDSYE